MLFTALKWMEPLCYPIGLVWFVILLIGLRALVKRNWKVAFPALLLAGAVSAFGSTKLSFKLMARLEKPFVRANWDALPTCDAVVMLGGTMARSTNDVLGFEVGGTADRMITAVELIRRQKAKTLVLGGGGEQEGTGGWREATAIQKWIETWNLLSAEIITLEGSRDTHDEAVQVEALVKKNGWKRVILVTSAVHMRRALALFNALQIPVEPVGCDFVGLAESSYHFSPVPNSDNLKPLEYYLHEVIGWFYYRARGWI